MEGNERSDFSESDLFWNCTFSHRRCPARPRRRHCLSVQLGSLFFDSLFLSIACSVSRFFSSPLFSVSSSSPLLPMSRKSATLDPARFLDEFIFQLVLLQIGDPSQIAHCALVSHAWSFLLSLLSCVPFFAQSTIFFFSLIACSQFRHAHCQSSYLWWNLFREWELGLVQKNFDRRLTYDGARYTTPWNNVHPRYAKMFVSVPAQW